MAPAVADDVRPASVAPCGNYAVQILWGGWLQPGEHLIVHHSLGLHHSLPSVCDTARRRFLRAALSLQLLLLARPVLGV